MQQTGTDNLARMYGHDGAPAISVAKEAMATFDSKNNETVLSKGCHQVMPAR